MPKMKLPKRIVTSKGSVLALDCDPTDGHYLQWTVGSGYMYGVLENTPELRRFLRFALRRLENERPARRRKSVAEKTMNEYIHSLKHTTSTIKIAGAEEFPTGLNLIKALKGDE